MPICPIESIDTIIVDLPTIRPHKLAMHTLQNQTLVVIRLRCSDGIEGIWMGVDHNAHTEANGSRIENDANNNIQTRLGFRTFIRTQEKNSGPHGDDFEPFVEMNWLHNSKDFAVSMNGVKVEQDGARNLGEIKLGVNGNLNPAASVWGNVGVQLGDNGYNDTAVMVGLKYKFI
ncbi:autotransporter outer membrane beta-barrel domain-containing protein [Alcaligenaceae bacterium SAGV5]|nr:autotransporter outer membrane beta-barrel domain-containing protein [Alcaligenaceae bacterium SAGV5]